jgi:hypothetical protein
MITKGLVAKVLKSFLKIVGHTNPKVEQIEEVEEYQKNKLYSHPLFGLDQENDRYYTYSYASNLYLLIRARLVNYRNVNVAITIALVKSDQIQYYGNYHVLSNNEVVGSVLKTKT